MAVHNTVELPDLPFYRPEYLFPSLLSLFLFLGWWKQAGRRRRWGVADVRLGGGACGGWGDSVRRSVDGGATRPRIAWRIKHSRNQLAIEFHRCLANLER